MSCAVPPMCNSSTKACDGESHFPSKATFRLASIRVPLIKAKREHFNALDVNLTELLHSVSQRPNQAFAEAATVAKLPRGNNCSKTASIKNTGQSFSYPAKN